jgi:hypothetical protein
MQKDVNIRISNECKKLDWLKKLIRLQLLTSAFSNPLFFLRGKNNLEQISNMFLKNFEELKFEINNLKKVMILSERENFKNKRERYFDPMSRK